MGVRTIFLDQTQTNSELNDGLLPDTIYKRGVHARYEIGLAILLTTMKKVRNVLILYEARKARPRICGGGDSLRHPGEYHLVDSHVTRYE